MKQFPQTQKAKNLVKLRELKIGQVPDFFVVSAATENIEVLKKIRQHFQQKTQLIFRTSVAGEDSGESSFAGLYESILDVSSKDSKKIIEALEICRKSLKSSRVTSYLKEKSIRRSSNNKSIYAEIIIQSYLKPSYSGVVFLYPEEVQNSLVSLGEKHNVTDGGKIIATLKLRELPTFSTKMSSTSVWRKLYKIITALAKKIDQPSDIEWIIHQNQPYLVQIRPITKSVSDSLFGSIVFDSTNLGENYPGLTAPLTYSFVRSAYSDVYQNYLKILKTKDSTITQNKYATSNLITYVEGRMYYNLENWYRLLKILPFYSFVKTAFDRMLKPVKSLTSIDQEPSQTSLGSSLLFLFYIIFPFIRTKKFELGFKTLYGNFNAKKWKTLKTLDLFYRFEQLRDSFFSLWANTIVNDFHVMIFWGLLVGLAQKTFQNPDLYLNSLVNASMLPESLKPLNSLVKISQIIATTSEYSKLFKQKPEKIWQSLSTDERYLSLSKIINEYLEKFGDRSGQELKIEVPKFSEEPEQVIRLIQMYLKTKNLSQKVSTQKNNKSSQHFVKQSFLLPILQIVKHIAVAGVYRREKYRIMRGKAYGIARTVFMEMGIRLKNDKLLESANDVFYLTYAELSSQIMFQSLPFDIKKVISLRKEQLKAYGELKPTTRVHTYGWNSLSNQLIHDQNQSSEQLKGTGTSITPPVSGEVVVMEEFSVDQVVAGKILVTKKTDPGWTVLFPMLKGVITEVGSTLSHASIIARELNIPCITGVNNCVNTLKTGDKITMIPQTGEVIRKNI